MSAGARRQDTPAPGSLGGQSAPDVEIPAVATFLYRVGRLAFRRRWYVALVWAAVLAAVGLGALKAPGGADEGFSMPGIESQKAFDLMEERFPGATADGATARVVFVAPNGQKVTAADHKKAVEDTVAGLADGSPGAGAG